MTSLATLMAPEWAAQALCADPAYTDTRDEIWFAPAKDKVAVSLAVETCFRCPVRLACLRAALDAEGGANKSDRYGISGGLTPHQRRQVHEELVRRKTGDSPKRKVAECGTRSGYSKHIREKSRICAPCRQANTDYDNRLRRTGTGKVAA